MTCIYSNIDNNILTVNQERHAAASRQWSQCAFSVSLQACQVTFAQV